MGRPFQRTANNVVLTRVHDTVLVGIVGGGHTSLTLEQARQLAGSLLELADPFPTTLEEPSP